MTLFDTAAMYSNGASERRLGDLALGTQALIGTKFPHGMRATAEDLPGALRASLARLRRPLSTCTSTTSPAGGFTFPP